MYPSTSGTGKLGGFNLESFDSLANLRHSLDPVSLRENYWETLNIPKETVQETLLKEELKNKTNNHLVVKQTVLCSDASLRINPNVVMQNMHVSVALSSPVLLLLLSVLLLPL